MSSGSVGRPRVATDRAPSHGGSPRKDRATSAAAEVVDLGAATALVAHEAEGTSEARAARSLFQTSTLGAVLTALRAGGSMHNDQPDEATIVQGIRGECLMSLDGHGAVLEPGTIVGIPPGVVWRILARTDAVVLVTVGRA